MCFYCHENWQPGHWCKAKVLNVIEGNVEEEDFEIAKEPSQENEFQQEEGDHTK